MAILNKIYLGLGSNLGDSKSILINAVKLISIDIGLIIRVSKVYISTALNPPENPDMQQPDYMNMAVLCSSSLSANNLKSTIQKIEDKLGHKRDKKIHWGPRLIDIDILAIGKKTIVNEVDLKIPHPELANRDFVLYPLLDIDPNFIHPITKKPIIDMLQEFNASQKSLIKDEFNFN